MARTLKGSKCASGNGFQHQKLSPSHEATAADLLFAPPPPQKEPLPEDYAAVDPEHKLIYRFVQTLFSAAQLTAECAIVTLVSLTPLPTPSSQRRCYRPVLTEA